MESWYCILPMNHTVLDKIVSNSKNIYFDSNDKIYDRITIQRALKHVTLRRITFRTMNAESLLEFADTLEDCGVTRLTFSWCSCDLKIVDAMIRCIETMKPTIVCLSRCALNCDAMIKIMTFIKQTPASTVELDLVWCTFSSPSESEIDTIFGLLEKSQLEKLSLDGFSLTCDQFIVAMKRIQNSSLKCLHLGYMSWYENNLGQFFKDDLGNAVEQMMGYIEQSQITDLQFSVNNFTIEEFVMICEVIKCSKIKKISFTFEPLGDDKVDAICDLIENSNIKSIDLSYGSVRASDTTKILNSVQKSLVTSLNLSRNSFDETCFLSVCNLLRAHPMKKLYLNNVVYSNVRTRTINITFSEDIIKTFIDCIKQSSLVKFKYRHIDSRRNFTSIELAEIKQVLKQNKQSATETKFRNMKVAM